MNKQLQDLLITIVAGMGMLLSTLDTGIINIALPFLKEQFQTSTDHNNRLYFSFSYLYPTFRRIKR